MIVSSNILRQRTTELKAEQIAVYSEPRSREGNSKQLQKKPTRLLFMTMERDQKFSVHTLVFAKKGPLPFDSDTSLDDVSHHGTGLRQRAG